MPRLLLPDSLLVLFDSVQLVLLCLSLEPDSRLLEPLNLRELGCSLLHPLNRGEHLVLLLL